jgi:hypothetical protein
MSYYSRYNEHVRSHIREDDDSPNYSDCVCFFVIRVGFIAYRLTPIVP